MHVLALALASLLAVDIEGPKVELDAKEKIHPAPWFLPRTASLGIQYNSPIMSATLRIAWEIGLIEQPRNHLVAMVILGSSLPISGSTLFTALYQHVAMAGIGYRSTRQLFHWGFSAGAGPIWYRAGYPKGSAFNFESRVITYAEVTGQIGLRLLDHFIAGIFAGYGAPWEVSNRFPATIYLGGFTAGVFADWR